RIRATYRSPSSSSSSELRTANCEPPFDSPETVCSLRAGEPRPAAQRPAANGSVDRPHTRRRQLEEVAVGIAKVYALAASRPHAAMFDRHAAVGGGAGAC